MKTSILNLNKQEFEQMSTACIRQVAEIDTKKLTKLEKESFNDKLDSLYMTIRRLTDDIYKRFNKN